MKIAVYSGSFDPLHTGHLAIMEYLTREGDFDCVYLVVSPQSPFKDSSKADNARQRFDAAVEAVNRHPGLSVTVDDIELGMPVPHYTVKTLDALKAREPGNEFTLVIGADNLAVFKGWREYGRIISEYGLVVYPRLGFDAAALRRTFRNRRNIRIVDAPMIDISSTRIREAELRGEDMSEYRM